MKVGCGDRDKVFKTSEASTKSWFRVNGLIDKYLNILDLKGFRKNNTKWSNYARVKHGIEGRLFFEENNGTKAVPNKEMFKQIDNAKGIFYQTDKSIKPGVSELFKSNPELASIGNQQQYSQYLDTIFPESKVKDIVYHGSDTQFEDFLEDNLNYFGTQEIAKGYGKNIYPVLIEIKKPYYEDGGNLSNQSYEDLYDKLDNSGADGFISNGNNLFVPKKSEQIHILGSKQDIEGFKEFVERNQFQLEASEEVPDSKIEQTIKDWLSKVGITYKAVDKIYDLDGNEISAVAKADIVAKLIEVVEGKRGIDTLPEETGHMLVRMLGMEHPLVQAMMKNVTKYKIYDEVINSNYGDLYANDEAKLREEAVGKVIAKVLVDKMMGRPIEVELRKEESRVAAIWNWIKQRIQRLIGTTAKDELQAFKKAADIVINSEPIVIDKDFEEGFYTDTPVFYQTYEEVQKNIVDKLKGLGVYYNVKEKAYFTKEGRRIKNRVTDLVKAMEAKWFRRKKETEMTPQAKQAAAAGTVTHSYFKEVTLTILEEIKGDLSKVGNTKPNFAEIQKRVIAELMLDPEIASRGENFIKSFTAKHFNEVVVDIKRRLDRIKKTQDLINKETGMQGKAEIMPEFTIFNPTKDLAGTIDLLVVYSNGKASIYDYKGQHFKSSGGKVLEDFRTSKIRSGNEQLGIYKDVLRDEFGIEEFIETRLVPFNFQFNSAGNIYNIEVGSTTNDRQYLDEVPVQQEKTGIKVIDKQLEKMHRELQKLQTESAANYKNEAMKMRLNNLYKSIQKLTVDRDTRYVYKEVNNILYDFQKRMTRPGEFGVDHYYLNELIKYLEIYEDFFREAKKIEKEGVNDEAVLNEIDIKYNNIYVKIQDTIAEAQEKNKEILTTEHPDIDFDKPVKEMSTLGGMFSRLSQFTRGQFKAFHRLVMTQQQQVREQIQELYDDLKVKKETLTIWANNNGKTLQQAMDMLIDLDKMSLKSKYSGVYGKEKAQAIKDKNYKWFEENTHIEKTSTAYKYKNAEDAKKFEDLKKQAFKRIEDSNAGNPEKIVKLKDNWEKRHDITKYKEAIFDAPYYIKIVENERFLSDIWKYMNQKGNEPLLNAYNTFIDLNIKLAEITGRDIKAGFIPEIQKGIIEGLSNWNAGLDAIKNNVKMAFKTREEDMLMGTRDSATGEVLPNIPLLYTDEIRIKLSPKELETLKKDLISKGLLEGTEAFITELNSLVYSKEREKGLLLKSRDLFTSALLFAETAYTFEYSQSIEEQVKAIRSTFKNAETELSAPNGKKMLDKLTGKIAKMVGVPQNELEAFDKFVKLYIYGQSKQNKDVVTEGGISANKTITQAMRYTSLKALGLSWIVGIGNAVGVTSNILMTASEGRYYTHKQLKDAFNMWVNGKNKNHVNAVLTYFSPYAHNLTYEMSRKLSTSKAKKHLNEEMFYMFMKHPDKAVDILNALAILQNFGIDEKGRVTRLKEGMKSILDSLDTSGNKVKGLNEQQFNAVRQLIIDSSTKIKGNLFKDDANLIGTNVYTAMFMQFRNWMPGLIENRFKGLTYDEQANWIDVGRFRVLYGEFTAKGLIPKLQTFTKLATEVVSLGAYKTLSNNANKAMAEKYFNKFLEQNPELRGKISLQDFIDLRQQKLRGMAMELRILMLLSLIVQMFGAMIPDDDEEAVQEWISKNAYRMTNRGLMEVTFFFDPSTVRQIAGQPLPLLKSITELQKFSFNTLDTGRDFIMGEPYSGFFSWEKQSNDKTPPLYYTSKILPTRAITDVIDFFGDHSKQIK